MGRLVLVMVTARRRYGLIIRAILDRREGLNYSLTDVVQYSFGALEYRSPLLPGHVWGLCCVTSQCQYQVELHKKGNLNTQTCVTVTKCVYIVSLQAEISAFGLSSVLDKTPVRGPTASDQG